MWLIKKKKFYQVTIILYMLYLFFIIWNFAIFYVLARDFDVKKAEKMYREVNTIVQQLHLL